MYEQEQKKMGFIDIKNSLRGTDGVVYDGSQSAINKIANLYAVEADIMRQRDGETSSTEFTKLYNESHTAFKKAKDAIISLANKGKVPLTIKEILPSIQQLLDQKFQDMVYRNISCLASKSISLIYNGTISVTSDAVNPSSSILSWSQEKYRSLANENNVEGEDVFIRVIFTKPDRPYLSGLTQLCTADGLPFDISVPIIPSDYIPSRLFMGLQNGDTLRYKERITVNASRFLGGISSERSDINIEFMIDYNVKVMQIESLFRVMYNKVG